jgi:hypothetical protein
MRWQGLKSSRGSATVLGMQRRQRKTPMSEQMRKALDDTGGEPLDGSGFENETAERDFSDSELRIEVPGE